MLISSPVHTMFGLHKRVCWSLTSLCHSNGHIETMPAREINPFTALTRIRSQFLRTQWSTSNHQRVDTTTSQTAQPSGLAPHQRDYWITYTTRCIYITYTYMIQGYPRPVLQNISQATRVVFGDYGEKTQWKTIQMHIVPITVEHTWLDVFLSANLFLNLSASVSRSARWSVENFIVSVFLIPFLIVMTNSLLAGALWFGVILRNSPYGHCNYDKHI